MIQKNQKIAIASEGKDVNSQVSPVSGRAPYYLIFENGELTKTIKNPFVYGSGGAGLGVGQMLYNEGVNLVISGKFGDKMIQMFNDKNMDYKIENNKKIKQIIDEIN
jgi:predicted Fe-Mo cluster-binding NifX family protein